MPDNKKPKQTQTLLGTGHAAVFGLARNFRLNHALENAKHIRIATAFARQSGWELIRDSVLRCKGRIDLLTGLQLNHTHPQVLTEWLELRESRGEAFVAANLASESVFFHPKVLIIEARKPSESFAVVGSGNLSDGGLGSNVECGVVLRDSSTIKALTVWFDDQLESGIALTETMIERYKPKFRAAEKKTAALTKAGIEATQDAAAIGKAAMREWDEALNSAVKYFKSPVFKAHYTKHVQGARRIRKALHAPEFTFNNEAFKDFFAEHTLGHVDERVRDKLFAQRGLRKALRELLKRPEAAIHEVLGRRGKLRVKYLGVGTVSKILAAHKLNDWPAYNDRADEALAAFGYQAPNTDPAGKYLAFRNLMKKFMNECRKRGCKPMDVLALDRFILYEWRKSAPHT